MNEDHDSGRMVGWLMLARARAHLHGRKGDRAALNILNQKAQELLNELKPEEAARLGIRSRKLVRA